MSNLQPVGEFGGAKKSGGGRCCLFGCMTVAVLGIVLLVGGYHGAKYLVRAYTQESAVRLPQVEMSEQELAEVRGRWDGFVAAAANGPARIELTARDVNALIANDPDWEKLKGGVYLTFGQSEVNGMISMELSELGSVFKGRYLNGQGVFDVSCVDGMLKIFVKDLQVAGKPLPDSVMNSLRSNNMAEGIYNNTDEQNRKLVEKLKRVKKLEFQDDLMIVDVQ